MPRAMVRGVSDPAREPWARAHATGMHAAEGASATEMRTAGMSEAAAAHPAATCMATTTALRPCGYGQRQGKRRDGCQATHTRTL